MYNFNIIRYKKSIFLKYKYFNMKLVKKYWINDLLYYFI